MDAVWKIAIVLLVAVISRADTLQNVRVVLPMAIRAGSSATLLCLYDLEGAPLYSVKWYRGRHEFFRFLPEEQPPSRVFPFLGISVDLSTSGARQVTLQNVPSYLSGEFSCEVSADAPHFSTACASATLSIVDFAGGRPVVTVEDSFVAVDQPLVANCTARAAKLDFYINNIQVEESQVIEWPGGATLQTNLERGNFSSQGELRLKCVASIGQSLRVSSASVVLWWVPEPHLYLESGSPVHNSSRLWLTILELYCLYLFATFTYLIHV